MKMPFYPADILLIKNAPFEKWSVVACDQYTSEPEYWQRVEKIVGDYPSCLKITLPEIYLNDKNVQDRIENINKNMDKLLEENAFEEYKNSFFYIERTQNDGKVRKGLIGAVDLEQYSYEKGSQSQIRATEGTVLERIPPRVAVRKNASLEAPHIMLLIDDREKSVIESIAPSSDTVYDFELMEKGGKIKGYALNKEECEKVSKALDLLAEKAFEKNENPLLIAVGDGNHSLATAKACYEALKKTTEPEYYLNHPARFALCELVNLHSEALEFEPIHRVIFKVDGDNFLKEMKNEFEICAQNEATQSFEILYKNKLEKIFIKNPPCDLAAGTVQQFIDKYIENNGGEVDYIHGEDTVEKLCQQENSIGILLPCLDKNELFDKVISNGALPRKTFSMGHSYDKRFYLECRKIK
ncbi:MAG: DUF1015 domain-containing protein [Ruminococcaceae bacterium]|nr:DUF1015 domain-containing protein [Oscillospiraceae bacterium]